MKNPINFFFQVLAGNPEDLYPDGRYNHILQVQERLNFLRFLLKDGQLWLCAPQAKQIWTCLAENAVFTQDREACFKWFSKLMGDEPDLGKYICFFLQLYQYYCRILRNIAIIAMILQ